MRIKFLAALFLATSVWSFGQLTYSTPTAVGTSLTLNGGSNLLASSVTVGTNSGQTSYNDNTSGYFF